MTSIARSALILLVIVCSFSGVGAQSPELVVNGAFELRLSPWWSKGTGILPVIHAGQSAASISGGFIVQEKISVAGGRNYRLSLDLFDAGSDAGSVYVQMSFRGTDVDTGWAGPTTVMVDGRVERAALVGGGGPGSWQAGRAVVFVAPANATEMILYLRKTANSPGAAYFTNVSVTQTDQPATDAADLDRQALVSTRFSPALPASESDNVLNGQQSAAGGLATNHPLFVAGTVAMAVHVGRDEDLVTLQAAADLADYSARIAGAPTGAALSDDLAPQSGPLLVIGRNNRLANQLWSDADFADLGDDGFLIRSFGPHILISGRTPRGTLYGANWFLDRKLGIRWLAPDATYLPPADDLSLPALNERQVPRFAFREVLSAEADNKAWRQRNLMNGQSHGPSFLPTSPAIDTWNSSWAAKGQIANFYELLPPGTYRETHPEWYKGGQLAMMDQAMRDEMARVVIERLRALPDYRSVWFAIHDMDWGWDMDAESRNFADQHGGHPSAPRLDMMIDIADQVRAVLPEAKLAFNAYHWSFTPPEGMTVPDYVLVYPMTVHVNYAEALDEPANRQLGEDLAGWNAIARHVLVWDHITNFGGFIQPTPNLLPIARSIAWLDSLQSVEGYMGEGSFNTPGAEFSALRAWMISRLLWDPTEDPQALIEDFSRHYYGPAAEPIIEYIALMHSRLAASGDVLAEKTAVTMAMFDADFIMRADALFAAATELASDPVHLARVAEARLPVDYVGLVRRDEYRVAPGSGTSFESTLAQRTARFWETIAAAGVKQYLQGGKLDELKQLIAIQRHTASRPEIVVDGEDWADIQDLSFNRYAGQKSAIVADPLASDGAAIALDRSATGWNTQLKLNNLPRQGEWWLYVSVRLGEASAGKDVLRIGSAPPQSCYITLAANDLATRTYTWVEVPGGTFAYSEDHARSLYLQPILGSEGQTLLIDRAVALPNRIDSLARPQPDGCPRF